MVFCVRRLLVLALVCAAASVPTVSTAETPSAGKLLVASPDMPDPRFAEAVIYICRHDDNGTFGLVLNRPTGSMPLAKLMDSLKLDGGRDATGAIEVRRGGPVEVGAVHVLHSDDFASKGAICQNGGATVSSSPDVLQALAAGRGPAHALLLLGYAGWEPDQLDDEISQGGWDVVPADASFLFDTPPEEMWRRARERRSLDL
jgi:putative transcriptional regulator